jgi:hypothetical protein
VVAVDVQCGREITAGDLGHVPERPHRAGREQSVATTHEHGGPLARREREGLDKTALADPCLADHEDDCARATADSRVERCIERGELPVSLDER